MIVLIELVLLTGASLLVIHYSSAQEETDRAAREETARNAMEQIEEQLFPDAGADL